MLHPCKQVLNPAKDIFVSHSLEGIHQVAEKRRVCSPIIDKRWYTFVVKYDPKNIKNMLAVIHFREFLRQLKIFINFGIKED